MEDFQLHIQEFNHLSTVNGIPLSELVANYMQSLVTAKKHEIAFFLRLL
jgi:hypothetical protein